ncbi:hypothetical protein Trydic_g10634, partial [Trypoxylus dichotomus]
NNVFLIFFYTTNKLITVE